MFAGRRKAPEGREPVVGARDHATHRPRTRTLCYVDRDAEVDVLAMKQAEVMPNGASHLVWAGSRLLLFSDAPGCVRCVAPNRHGLPCGRQVSGVPSSVGSGQDEHPDDEAVRWVMQRCWFHSPRMFKDVFAAPLSAAPVQWSMTVTENAPPPSALAENAVMFVAVDPTTSPATLGSLAADPSDELRAAVARHPRCPADTLVALVTDPSPVVRHAVLDNPAADDSVRSYAALND